MNNNKFTIFISLVFIQENTNFTNRNILKGKKLIIYKREEMKLQFFAILLIFATSINALTIDNKSLVETEHGIRIEDITSIPENLIPGESGILTISLKNWAELEIKDIITKLVLPPEIKIYKDVDINKISELKPGESKEVNFQIIASPSAKEGIYEGSLIISYINFFGANFVNIGEKKQDNYTLSIIIKSTPKLFVIIENSEIYKGNDIGDVSIKFINNGLSDIKFLTVELEETDDYDIISSPKKYIGDVDSNDFDSIDFRLKMNRKKDSAILPLKIDYKDSLNNNYEEKSELKLEIRSAKEIGKSNEKITFYIIAAIIFIIIIVYYFYRKSKIAKHKKHHHYSH